MVDWIQKAVKKIGEIGRPNTERNGQMNLDTVLKCAQIAANVRQSSLGFVDEDIQELLAQLTPPVEEPVPVEEPAPVEEPVLQVEESQEG